MFVQITIVKVNDDTFKVTLFNETGVIHSERIDSITEVLATAHATLQQLQPHPRSAYAQDPENDATT